MDNSIALGLLAILAPLVLALTGAVGKLWSDQQKLLEKYEALSREHMSCQVSLAAQSAQIRGLQESVKELEDIIKANGGSA